MQCRSIFYFFVLLINLILANANLGWAGWGMSLPDHARIDVPRFSVPNRCIDFEVTAIDADVGPYYRNEFLAARNIEVTIENVGTMDFRAETTHWPETVSLVFMDGRGRGPTETGLPYLVKVASLRAGHSATYLIPDHVIGPIGFEQYFANGEVSLKAIVDMGDIKEECAEDNNDLTEYYEVD